MKVNLVVTTAGPNNGRTIPITAAEFLIGRDPDCQLRPASPAISKHHCKIAIRDGQVYVSDMGSTNGTEVNGAIITDEVVVVHGTKLKVGPLEFNFDIRLPQRKSDSTPLPEQLKVLTPSLEAFAAAVGPAANPAAAKAPAASAAPAPKPAPAAAKPKSAHEDADDAAALLLGMDDDNSSSDPSIPEGSTIMEIPAIDPAKIKEAEDKKKKTITGAQMSAAANDILRKYIRRTGN
jgi:pSer/pThr/pTyr-binding forkhead associated (FHA) protein